MDEIDFYPDDVLIDSAKTDNNGCFLIGTYVDKTNPGFWLKIKEFAQINVLIPNLDTTKQSDTIDLRITYLVPYDNELTIKEHNMPESKKKEIEKYEKFSISQVDSIFSIKNSPYKMELNPVDTIVERTGYNFGPNTPRGISIMKYKQLTFQRIIK